MEVQAFEKMRADKLNEYKKGYEIIKRDYSTTMDAAIQEGDPKEQNDLIEKVLSLNSELSEFLRAIIADLNKGQNSISSTTVSQLSAELIKYQQEFQAVKESEDKIKTLKILQGTNAGLADEAVKTYYFYLAIIGLLTVICVYLAIQTAWSTSLLQTVSTASASVVQ
jgi:hypothetical protein